MISTEFLITSFIVVLLPGSGAIYTISIGLFHNARASAFAALGCTIVGIIRLYFGLGRCPPYECITISPY